jgi:hypothetical protein
MGAHADAATAVQGATASASGGAPAGSLPFTGFKEDLLMALGGALLLLGIALHVTGRRLRRPGAAAA